MRNHVRFADRAAMLVGLALLSAGLAAAEERETVLDRKVHIEKEIVLQIPDVPPLCDGMQVWKQHVDIGDCKLYCEREGTGIPIVLLHGGPGCTHHVFHPYFSRAAGFAEVVYYDQRGCGVSDYTPGKGYSVEHAADDLDALRTALKIDRWVVLGHSYGGTLAQCYAVKYPERIAGLILVSSAFYGLPITTWGSRQQWFISDEEGERIDAIHHRADLSLAQLVFNAHLNGDWKRQNFYRPSQEDLARMALYEWKHDGAFRARTIESLHALDSEGEFDDCPWPVLIMEGQWDLTWTGDKPGKLWSCFHGAKLVLLERSGHSPFADEPEAFFRALQRFIEGLPHLSDADLSKWKTRLATQRKERLVSPKYILKKSGLGRASSAKIAAGYSKKWLAQVEDPQLLLRAGFALYDVKRYEEALAAFARMAERASGVDLAIARIWQAHMLDLLGKRDEAVALYQSVADMKINTGVQHSQYELSYSPNWYASFRVNNPFARLENQAED